MHIRHMHEHMCIDYRNIGTQTVTWVKHTQHISQPCTYSSIHEHSIQHMHTDTCVNHAHGGTSSTHTAYRHKVLILPCIHCKSRNTCTQTCMHHTHRYTYISQTYTLQQHNSPRHTYECHIMHSQAPHIYMHHAMYTNVQGKETRTTQMHTQMCCTDAQACIHILLPTSYIHI